MTPHPVQGTIHHECDDDDASDTLQLILRLQHKLGHDIVDIKRRIAAMSAEGQALSAKIADAATAVETLGALTGALKAQVDAGAVALVENTELKAEIAAATAAAEAIRANAETVTAQNTPAGP